jgi:hypothetical protein
MTVTRADPELIPRLPATRWVRRTQAAALAGDAWPPVTRVESSATPGGIKLKLALRTTLTLATLLVGGGCALFGIETGYRSLTIKNHRFEPARIEVPKNARFLLTVDAIDDRDLTISAPELGITRLRIPATEKDPRFPSMSRAVPDRHASLPLGPLNEGRYTVFCECHGNPVTADIIVK